MVTCPLLGCRTGISAKASTIIPKRHASPKHLKQSASCIVDKQLSIPNITSQHGFGGMAGLLANFPARHPSLCCAGGQTRSQAMTGIAGRIDTNRVEPFFYDQTYSPSRQWLKANSAVAVDWPKQCALHNAGPSQPLFEGTRRAPTAPRERNADLATLADLIGFRATKREDHALTHAINVAAGQAHQFRPPKTSREPDQQATPCRGGL